MTYTKHAVQTDALDYLGSILTEAQAHKVGRDAVHIACIAVQAGTDLPVGAHVSIREDGRAYQSELAKGVGIVDPFLLKNVSEEDWFILQIYPRVISSLRHVWEHPAFPPSALAESENAIANVQRRQELETWLRDFCDEAGVRFSTVMYRVNDWINSEGTDYEDPYLGISAIDYAHKDPTDEFWDKLSEYIGREITPSQRTYEFYCGC